MILFSKFNDNCGMGSEPWAKHDAGQVTKEYKKTSTKFGKYMRNLK
jgi:hypothetical protein